MVEDGKKVSAYNTKSFVFLREKSVGDPAVDNITTVNIPAWVSHEVKVLDKGRKVELQVGESEACVLWLSSALWFLSPPSMPTTSSCILLHLLSTLPHSHFLSTGCNEQGEREFLQVLHGVHLDELFGERSLHYSHGG